MDPLSFIVGALASLAAEFFILFIYSIYIQRRK